MTAVADLVHLHVTADLPIRVQPLTFAGRVELRLGNAFPAVLLIDREALPRVAQAVAEGQAALDAVTKPRGA